MESEATITNSDQISPASRRLQISLNADKQVRHPIYIMISRTPTKFGYVIRKVGRIQYNHTSIALDAELKQLYSFARVQHNAVLAGGLVRETLDRYTLKKYSDIDVVIFRLAVTTKQLQWLKKTIRHISSDEEYIYNLPSVILFPLMKGFSTHKAYTCIEFIMFILANLQFEIEKPFCRYKPDDLIDMLQAYIHYRGNLLDYAPAEQAESDYFAKFTVKLMKRSAYTLKEYVRRAVKR